MNSSIKSNDELFDELKNLHNRFNELKALYDANLREMHIIAEKLENSQQINSFIYDSLSDGGVIFEDGKVVFSSRNNLSFLGYDAILMGDFSLKKLYGLVHPDDLSNVIVAITAAYSQHESLVDFYRLRNVNDKYIWVECNIKFDKDSGSQPTRSSFVIKDISQRINSEEALKKSETKFRFLTEHCSDVVWHLDKNYCCDYISLADEKMRGYKQEEVIGTSLFDILKPEAVEMLKINIAKRMAAEKLGLPVELPNYELEEKCKDGSWVWVEATANPEYDEFGNSIGLHGVTRNITERKKAEAELKLKTDQLEMAIADKDRFMSILAHDLRSPFSSILGFLELLSNNINVLEKSEIESYINVSLESTIRTFNLLEDLLLWGQAKSGKLPFSRHDLCLQTICHDIVSVFCANAQTKSIVVNNLVCQGSLVYADSNMLKTILRNLISNAIKFTNDGGVINISSSLAANGIIISVADNGVGIKPESLRSLFLTQQIYTTRGTADESGSGLGLFLCKEFVDKHNGEIWVESSNDDSVAPRGTVFSFIIPNN